MVEASDNNGDIPERLESVEDDLETVKRTLVAVASVVESNRESIDQLTDSLDQLTVRLDRLAITQENTQVTVDQLARLMVQFIQNAESDRVFMRELQLEVRGIQAESQRILEYLFGQSDSP